MSRFIRYPLIPAFANLVIDETDKVDKKFLKDPSEYQDITGWQRVKDIFKSDEFGRITPELSYMTQAAFMGALTGFIYGGFLGSRKNYLDFMERNQATSFISHLEAKKKLQDQVTLGFAKYGFRFAWRLCYFTTTYTSFVTCISVYRGKSSVLEHTVAGIMTGSMYKINLGLRGMVAGGLVGGVLGTMAGTVTYGVLLLTGKTMEELRQYQYQWSSTRKEATFEATKKQLEGTELSDTMGIMEYHDRQLSRHNIDLKKVAELIEKEQAELKAEELKKSETKDVQ